MINLYCLATSNSISWWCCFWLHTLYFFWRSWSYRNRRYLLFLLYSSLVNLWHFVCLLRFILTTLSVIDSSSVSKTSSLSRCTRSLSTVHSSSTTSHWICRCSDFKSTRKCTCWRITNTSLTHELTNVLSRGWTS